MHKHECASIHTHRHTCTHTHELSSIHGSSLPYFLQKNLEFEASGLHIEALTEKKKMEIKGKKEGRKELGPPDPIKESNDC